MIFVDTGYFIALLEPADALHDRARRWANKLSERLITTEYVVIETYNRFSRPQNRSKLSTLETLLLSSTFIEIVPSSHLLFESGRSLHGQRLDKSWSLTDCISFHVMRDRRISTALAHDHHFVQAGFEALLQREP